MKKYLLIANVPVFVFGMFFAVHFANAAGNPTISGTVTYDDYASGNIIIAILSGMPGDPGTSILGPIASIPAPGAYSITLGASYSGEAVVFSWNDVKAK